MKNMKITLNYYFDPLEGYSEETFRNILVQRIQAVNGTQVVSINVITSGFRITVNTVNDIRLILSDLASISIEYEYVVVQGIPEDEIVRITDR